MPGTSGRCVGRFERTGSRYVLADDKSRAMKWGWLNWIGVIGAGFGGGSIAMLAVRIPGNWHTLLINSDVVGAAIGSMLTISATLAIGHHQRSAERRERIDPLISALNVVKGVADDAQLPVDMEMPLTDRAQETASNLGALRGSREPVAFARSRADFGDIGIWLKLESLKRSLDHWDDQIIANKAALSSADVSEADWIAAHHVLVELLYGSRPA